MNKKGLNAYKQVGIRDQLGTADPYQIIQMLMQGAIDRMVMARSAIDRKDLAAKSEHVSKATAIVKSLNESLHPVDGGEDVVNNLASLYDFIVEHLLEASRENSSQKIHDCQQIMTTIKEGWDSIPQDVRISTLSQNESLVTAGG
tara:strand:+ start:2104 stop:2538 length:435 start_codon:yes stop_codon:yes gene_type:complete